MNVLKRFVPKQLTWEYRKLNYARISAVKDAMSADLIYFRMPKVASQTITHALEATENVNSAVIPHSLAPYLVRSILRIRKRSLRFSFVRHPYSRFVSAYKWATRDDIDAVGYVLDVPQHSVVSSYRSMNDFAIALPSIYQKHHKCLIHFVPQAEWIADGDRLLVDFCGKLEDFDSGVAHLSRMGVNLSIAFGANAKNAQTTASPEDSAKIALRYGLTNDAARALAVFYERDFSLFGYSS